MKVYVSLKGDKLTCFAYGKGPFLVHYFAHDSWKEYFEVGVSSPRGVRMHQKFKQGTQKNCAQKFLILPALKLLSCGPVVL